ncbi:hypothetical protein KAR52_03140 [Candidatus Pacearchaeota archaeon]|nr:hypothetical protein [Candidatus Pacearchaeota archaeon]
MRKIILFISALIGVILLSQFISAKIIIISPPQELYNLGDVIHIPIKFAPSIDIKGEYNVILICNGIETKFSNDLVIEGDKEELINMKIILSSSRVGRSTGICKVKVILGEEFELTNEFKISNIITVTPRVEETEFYPEQEILIEGEAIKENGKNTKGFVEITITHEDGSEIKTMSDTVNNGYYFINFSFQKETKAGTYSIKVNVYESDSSNITNQGSADYNILIKQVPTSLEIILENPEVEPGTDLKVKAILHDQTGEHIASNVIITIKNEKDKILEQSEKSTDEFLEFPIAYNEPPKEWTIFAVSDKITSEITFEIKEKEKVEIKLINRTVLITNTGNVFYNKTVLVKIGNETKHIDVGLDVDKDQKYILSAPDGEYSIEVIADGNNKITGMVMLTGKVFDVKETSVVGSLMKYPAVWIFLIIILGAIIFLILKKGHKRIFFGHKNPKKEKRKKGKISQKQSSAINSKNKAELSLSIKGSKQNASIICLKIKNPQEVGLVKDTLQKVVDVAEENKALTYENQNNFFFIVAPVKTRTFKNEVIALKIVQKIEEIIANHNKLFKQRMDFGISLNYGAIIAKQEKDSLKFMSMGTLITLAKKISSLSNGEILLSEKIKERLMSDIKTEKVEKDGVEIYKIKEIKNKKANKKFINSFVKRIAEKK